MNKKNWLFLFLAGAFALTFNACKKSDDTDSTVDTGPTEWTKSTVFTGDPRGNAAYFQIGNTGYVVGGALRTNERLDDAWSFSNELWSPIEDFPGGKREGAVGFAIGTKGYVGLGRDGAVAFDDFYEYDSESGTWTTIPIPFDGEARYGAVAFTLGGYAYVGAGATVAGKGLSDFYKFDPATNGWERIEAKFTSKFVNGFAFVIGNKAYVGGGLEIGSGQYSDDFFSFDGSNWVRLSSLNRADDSYTYDVRRQNTAAFAIGNYGYVAGGNRGTILGNVWKYDPASDSWTDKHQAFQGTYREGAVAFSIGGKGYVATGQSSASKYDDNWVFTPVR